MGQLLEEKAAHDASQREHALVKIDAKPDDAGDNRIAPAGDWRCRSFGGRGLDRSPLAGLMAKLLNLETRKWLLWRG